MASQVMCDETAFGIRWGLGLCLSVERLDLYPRRRQLSIPEAVGDLHVGPAGSNLETEEVIEHFLPVGRGVFPVNTHDGAQRIGVFDADSPCTGLRGELPRIRVLEGDIESTFGDERLAVYNPALKKRPGLTGHVKLDETVADGGRLPLDGGTDRVFRLRRRLLGLLDGQASRSRGLEVEGEVHQRPLDTPVRPAIQAFEAGRKCSAGLVLNREFLGLSDCPFRPRHPVGDRLSSESPMDAVVESQVLSCWV